MARREATFGGDLSASLAVWREAPGLPLLTFLLANLVAAPLIAHAGTLAGRVNTGGSVIISGYERPDAAAVHAVEQWRYRPATLNRRAVRVALSVTVRFSLH